jgi:hypothetical protein
MSMTDVFAVIVLLFLVRVLLIGRRTDSAPPLVVVTQPQSTPGPSVLEVVFWLFILLLLYLVSAGGLTS